MQSAPKPCTQCGVLVRDGSARCEAHKHVGRFGDIRRGSRQSRGYGADWDRRRDQVLKRDAGICQPCMHDGVVHQGNEVDHKIPKAQGGTDDLDNLQTICRARHRAKTQAEARYGGGEKSGAFQQRTGPDPIYLRAQVSGVGGVKPALGEQASVPAVRRTA